MRTDGEAQRMERLRFALTGDTAAAPGPDRLPFGVDDATAGAENELLTVVYGSREDADLAQTIASSNYFLNLQRRAAAGDASRRLLADIERHLESERDGVWENSWVVFPLDALCPYAQEVFDGDLFADRQQRGERRADQNRFLVMRNGARCARVPVSYVLKLALADAIGSEPGVHPAVRAVGERLMRHFLNDNTSPETFSFHPVGDEGGGTAGRRLAEETLRRFLLSQWLILYANDKFELRSRGQETQVCLAPQTPWRQRRLNELVSDSFYRQLFMSPCLSGWDRGEEKHHYMILCHEALSRSRLHTMGKLRECGILSRNLITLPTVSNTSLANNGTHISLGSRRLTALMAAGSPDCDAADEKCMGDLAIKIAEHFLPLFVGVYTAAPHRFDFADFHPESALGFLPHELDYTHLRMLWRRWKGKADLRCCGATLTPFGPVRLDRALGRLLGLRGDCVPDQRLLDYLVAPLGTDHSPALDGTLGNDERLKRDLAEMGVFDTRMSLYAILRQRLFGKVGFCGFEGRHYSQFADLTRDLAAAADLQRLILALAYQYALSGQITHADIPDAPDSESERRQMFFGCAIGLPTFFVRARTPNRFLARLLAKTARIRDSRRYPGCVRVYHLEYRRALVAALETDGAALIEALGLADTVADLKRRIRPDGAGSTLRELTDGILREAGASSPMRLRAADFNDAAERYYRGPLHRHFVGEALDLLERDLGELAERPASATSEIEAAAMADLLKNEEPRAFLGAVRDKALDGKVSQSVLLKLIGLTLLTVKAHAERHGETL